MAGSDFLRSAYRLGREISRRSPHLAELADAVASGKADQKTLRRHAMNVALPGLGDHTERFVGNVGRAIQAFGRDVAIEGDETLPWVDAARHINALPGGLIVTVGAKNFGKTQFLLFMADKFRRKHGFPVETVNLWEDDLPPWATPIAMDRVIDRVNAILNYLGQEDPSAVIDDGLRAVDRRPKKKPRIPVERWQIEKMKRRIICIDEAKAVFSALAAADQQQSREALRNFVNELRHMQIYLIVAIQKLSELPEFLQDDALMFLKWAPDSYLSKDNKPGQVIANRDLWTEALSALNQVRYSRYYEPPFDTIKAWSYLVSGNLGGHGFRGLVPNLTWRAAADEDGEDDDADDPDVVEGTYEVLDGQ